MKYAYLLVALGWPILSMEKPPQVLGKTSPDERPAAVSDEEAKSAKRARQATELDKNFSALHQSIVTSRPEAVSRSLFADIQDQDYAKCLLLAQFYNYAEKILQKRLGDKRKEQCFISCDIVSPITFNATLPEPQEDNKVVYTLIALDKQHISIPQDVAKHVGTVRHLAEDVDCTIGIDLNADSSSLTCIIKCISALLYRKQQEIKDPHEFLHKLYKPFVLDTHFVNLCNAVNHLDIPLLSEYLVAYAASYIIQETDMQKLGHFLKCCEQLTPDFAKMIANKLLNARRTMLIEHLAKSSSYQTSEIRDISAKDLIIVMNSPKQFTLFNSRTPNYRIKITGFDTLKHLDHMLLHDQRIPHAANNLCVDPTGKYILYRDKDSSIMRLALDDSSQPVCISEQAPASNSPFKHKGDFDIFVRKNDSGTVILDARYAQPIIMSTVCHPDVKLEAYNGNFAFFSLNNSGTLFSITPEGKTAEIIRRFDISPENNYYVCPEGPTLIAIRCAHHHINKIAYARNHWKKLAHGTFATCTNDGLLVLDDTQIIFYDVRTKKYIACCSDDTEARRDFFISDDGTRIYVAFVCNKTKETFTVKFFAIDLFGDILKQPHAKILPHLACLLHKDQAHMDAYLNTMLAQIPASILNPKVYQDDGEGTFPMHRRTWEEEEEDHEA